MEGDKTFLCAMAVYDEETQRRIEEMRARLVGAALPQWRKRCGRPGLFPSPSTI